MKSGLLILVGGLLTVMNVVLADSAAKNTQLADIDDVNDWIKTLYDNDFEPINDIISAKGRSSGGHSGGSRGSRSKSSYSSKSKSYSSSYKAKSGSYKTSSGYYTYYNSPSYINSYTGPAVIAIYGYPGYLYHAYGYQYSNCGYNCYPGGCYTYNCSGSGFWAAYWQWFLFCCCCCVYLCLDSKRITRAAYNQSRHSSSNEGSSRHTDSFHLSSHSSDYKKKQSDSDYDEEYEKKNNAQDQVNTVTMPLLQTPNQQYAAPPVMAPDQNQIYGQQQQQQYAQAQPQQQMYGQAQPMQQQQVYAQAQTQQPMYAQAQPMEQQQQVPEGQNNQSAYPTFN